MCIRDRPEVAHHPRPGAERAQDAEDASTRVGRGTGDDADDAPRVFVRCGGRHRPGRRHVGAEQALDDRRATGEVQPDVDHSEPAHGSLGRGQQMAGFGDPEQTGKPAGDDVREGKRTVLIAYTLDVAADRVGELDVKGGSSGGQRGRIRIDPASRRAGLLGLSWVVRSTSVAPREAVPP